ncbi:MAG: hypothetical protein DWQ06_08915 [Calditrichaeota bacterium]|nr:MAG: hypothetical protein DWQ06_08915 [Calditrichota bacterium]
MAFSYNINLNKEAKENKDLLALNRTTVLGTVLGAIVFMAVFAFAYVRTEQLGARHSELQKQLQQIEDEITRIKTEGKSISEQDIRDLAQVEESRIFWTEKFTQLPDLIPSGMAFTAVTFNNGRLSLDGIARVKVKKEADEKNIDIVIKLINNLESDASFYKSLDDIKFELAELTTIKGEIVDPKDRYKSPEQLKRELDELDGRTKKATQDLIAFSLVCNANNKGEVKVSTKRKRKRR